MGKYKPREGEGEVGGWVGELPAGRVPGEPTGLISGNGSLRSRIRTLYVRNLHFATKPSEIAPRGRAVGRNYLAHGFTFSQVPSQTVPKPFK